MRSFRARLDERLARLALDPEGAALGIEGFVTGCSDASDFCMDSDDALVQAGVLDISSVCVAVWSERVG